MSERSPRMPIGPSKPQSKGSAISGTQTPAGSRQPSSKSLPASREPQRPKEAAIQFDPNEPEWEELVQRIASSDLLERGGNGRKLLLFLWRNRTKNVTAKFIEVRFFRQELGKKPSERERSAMALTTLRKKLAEYGEREKHEKWLCDIPVKPTGEGYTLRFSRFAAPIDTAAKRFWKAHLDQAEDTVVVSGSHLFFFNQEKNIVFRLPFFNPKQNWDEGDIIKHFKMAHPEIDIDGFAPWQNTYLATGDVEAYQALAGFFHRETGTFIERKTNHSITLEHVRRQAPILVGRPQTNPYIDAMFKDSAKASGLGYRIAEQKGLVRINGIRKKERADLKAFKVSPEGVVGPIIEMGKVFGIVSRFPNPGGRGPITIIACDYYARVIGRIVQALTNDKDAQEILDQVGWPEDKPLPDAFEMLFTVDLLEGDKPDESFPKLVTWRVP